MKKLIKGYFWFIVKAVWKPIQKFAFWMDSNIRTHSYNVHAWTTTNSKEVDSIFKKREIEFGYFYYFYTGYLIAYLKK